MIANTKAIVLGYIKYSESSLITQLYTEDFGMKTFMVKGVRTAKSTKKNHFYPLTELEISYTDKGRGTMISLYKTDILKHRLSLSNNPLKAMMSQFIAELLKSCLKEEEANLELYHSIQTFLNHLNTEPEFYADYHLIFLLQLTTHLGFMPNFNKPEEKFDLLEGIFTASDISAYTLNKSETELFIKLGKLRNYEQSNRFNREERKLLMAILIDFYALHIPNFKEPRALTILTALLN